MDLGFQEYRLNNHKGFVYLHQGYMHITPTYIVIPLCSILANKYTMSLFVIEISLSTQWVQWKWTRKPHHEYDQVSLKVQDRLHQGYKYMCLFQIAMFLTNPWCQNLNLIRHVWICCLTIKDVNILKKMISLKCIISVTIKNTKIWLYWNGSFDIIKPRILLGKYTYDM